MANGDRRALGNFIKNSHGQSKEFLREVKEVNNSKINKHKSGSVQEMKGLESEKVTK